MTDGSAQLCHCKWVDLFQNFGSAGREQKIFPSCIACRRYFDWRIYRACPSIHELICLGGQIYKIRNQESHKYTGPCGMVRKQQARLQAAMEQLAHSQWQGDLLFLTLLLLAMETLRRQLTGV